MDRMAMLRGLFAVTIVGAACGAGPVPEGSEATLVPLPPVQTNCPPPKAPSPPLARPILADTVMTVGSDSAIVIGADNVTQCVVLYILPSRGNTTILVDRNP